MTTGIAVLQQRVTDDRRDSEQFRQQSEAALREIERIAERIKRMNEIYRERLEGRRRGR